MHSFGDFPMFNRRRKYGRETIALRVSRNSLSRLRMPLRRIRHRSRARTIATCRFKWPTSTAESPAEPSWEGFRSPSRSQAQRQASRINGSPANKRSVSIIGRQLVFLDTNEIGSMPGPNAVGGPGTRMKLVAAHPHIKWRQAQDS